MNSFFYILKKIIKSKNNRFYKLSNHSIVGINILCILFVSIILSVSNGFKNNVCTIITNIEGYASKVNSLNSNDKIAFGINRTNPLSIIDSNYTVEIIDVDSYHMIIRTVNHADGISLIALDDNQDIIDEYILSISDIDGIIIGESLLTKLGVNINDNVFLYAYNSDNLKEIITVKIAGIFKTNLSEFDNHRVYINKKLLDGVNISSVNYSILYNEYDNISPDLKKKIEKYEYVPWFESEQYKDFYRWLNQYDLPIYFLLLLIIVISVVNNISCYNLDRVNRVKEISIYTILGIDKYQIRLILILKNIFLNIVGIIIGSFLSFIILGLEYKYHWIKLPPDIYFSDTLPITFDIRFYLYPSLIILLISLIYLTLTNIRIKRSV